MMLIGSHHHFWDLERGDYDWPNETVAPIFKNYNPEDLIPHLQGAGVSKTILVQATDSIEETHFLLSLAKQHEFIAGVVGWVDFTDENAINKIKDMQTSEYLCVLRPMLQGIPDTDWIMQPRCLQVLKYLEDSKLCFDALVQPRHLENISKLANLFPTLKIVIDHMAKPDIANEKVPDSVWKENMKRLGRHPNIHCKLSGMVTEDGDGWAVERLRPYADIILSSFGANKVLWGSDWPVVELRTDYQTWYETALSLVPKEYTLSVFGKNAARFYDVK